MKREGINFREILNDLKRRPEDAARELGVSEEEINNIIEGKIKLNHDIIAKAAEVWPVNERDFYLMKDDCPDGIKKMTAEESKKSGRIMERAGKDYYEYRDTVMSSLGPFRPEWIASLPDPEVVGIAINVVPLFSISLSSLTYSKIFPF